MSGRLTRKAFENALRDMDTYIDVTVDDLMAISSRAERYAQYHSREVIPVAEFMTRPVRTVHRNTPLKQAAHLLLTHRISGLPVVDDADKLVGVITEADFLRALGVPSHHASHTIWQTLEAMFTSDTKLQDPQGPVSALMVKDVVTIRPEQTVCDVLETMKRHRIKRLVAIDDGRQVVGIITRSDLVNVFFDELVSEPSPLPSGRQGHL